MMKKIFTTSSEKSLIAKHKAQVSTIFSYQHRLISELFRLQLISQAIYGVLIVYLIFSNSEIITYDILSLALIAGLAVLLFGGWLFVLREYKKYSSVNSNIGEILNFSEARSDKFKECPYCNKILKMHDDDCDNCAMSSVLLN